jgi:hypothetical protein
LLIAYERAQTLGRDPEIRRAMGVVRYLAYRRATSAPEGVVTFPLTRSRPKAE